MRNGVSVVALGMLMAWAALAKGAEPPLVMPQSCPAKTVVAQVSNLLYRGFPIRRRLNPPRSRGSSATSRLEVGDTADWKSALQPGKTERFPPLRVRAQNFTVLPSTGPVTHIVVKNRLTTDYTGALRVEFPAGWKVTPAQHALALRPGEIKKLAFTIERGADVKTNAYPVRIQVEGSGGAMQVEQLVLCASVPYHKPVIDGDLAEWKDAIPITFATAGRHTTVSGYWSGKQFALAVEVEEDRLIGLKEAAAGPGLDAVQFALSPAEGEGRWEFLIAAVDASASAGRCYLLCKPGQEAALAGQRRSLAGLEFQEAKVAVKRDGKVTRYEVSVPFALMPELKPTAGREFFFSLLVHDPGDTGVRDLGEVMNLWPEDRPPGGWCSWEFVRWGDKTPWPSRIEFGFCSSIH